MSDHHKDNGLQEFYGELIRGSGGFVLEIGQGERFPLELSRVPVNLVGKAVVVTGEAVSEPAHIVAHYIRQDG